MAKQVMDKQLLGALVIIIGFLLFAIGFRFTSGFIVGFGVCLIKEEA